MHSPQYVMQFSMLRREVIEYAEHLPIDVLVPGMYPEPHQANILEKVLFCALLPHSLTHLCPISDDRDAFGRIASGRISLLSGCLSTISAQACAYMSQVATYRICVSTGSTPSTVLYVWNACGEEPKLLASPAHRRGIWGISGAISLYSGG